MSVDDEACNLLSCFGTGFMDWSDAEIERAIRKGNAPTKCRSCKTWEQSLPANREIRCNICGERETRTKRAAFGIPRFNKIDLAELGQEVCARCIRLDSAAREQRRERKLAAGRVDRARSRTYEAFASGREALRGQGASKRARQAVWARARMGPDAVTTADHPEIIGERLRIWNEPLARQEPARLTRFVALGSDGAPWTDERPVTVKESQWETFENRFNEADVCGRALYTALIANPTIDHALLVQGFGNPNIPSNLAVALPRALARLLISHPNTAGVFQPIAEYRHIEGRGDIRSWAADRATGGKTTGKGAAYEIIGLDSLIQGARKALPVYPLDALTLGHKITFNGVYDGKGVNGRASKRGGAPPGADDGAPPHRVALASAVGDRRTIEADALITRGTGGNTREIAIDFKYAATGKVPDFGERAKPTKPTSVREQIAGAVLAIEQGMIDEFHFVSNRAFGAGFEEQVRWGNELLTASGFGQNRIQLHTHVGGDA